VYDVYIEQAAENDLKRLPASTFQRIIPQIKALAENPRPSGCRKIDELVKSQSARHCEESAHGG